MTYISRIIAIFVLAGIINSCDSDSERNKNRERKATQVVMCVPVTHDRDWFTDSWQWSDTDLSSSRIL